MNNTIFRKKSLERISSPDQLDDYLKVSSPSVWVVLAALILALIAAGAWCFLGSMPTTASGVGIRMESGTVCFVAAEEGYSIEPGMQVQFTPAGSDETVAGEVIQVEEPVPAQEAGISVKAEWLSMPGDWVCPVTVKVKEEDLPEGASLEVSIILDERRPVDLLLGR